MSVLQRVLSREGRAVGNLTARSNEEWIAALSIGGEAQRRAIEDLRLVLIRGLRHGLSSRLDRRGVSEQIEDFAQDAILRILGSLDTFRGESLFTTWAQKIALRIAFSELRRKQWENVSLDRILDEEDGRRPGGLDLSEHGADPEGRTSAATALETVNEIIDTTLTDLQRRAITAVAVHGMPIEEVSRALGTNRNALYKLLHDARRKVAREVARRGIDIDDLLSPT